LNKEIIKHGKIDKNVTETSLILFKAMLSGPKSCNPAASDFLMTAMSLRTPLKLREIERHETKKEIKTEYPVAIS
jgi:hypothetical protein